MTRPLECRVSVSEPRVLGTVSAVCPPSTLARERLSMVTDRQTESDRRPLVGTRDCLTLWPSIRMAAAVGERVLSLSPPPLCAALGKPRAALIRCRPSRLGGGAAEGPAGLRLPGCSGIQVFAECPVRGMRDCLIG